MASESEQLTVTVFVFSVLELGDLARGRLLGVVAVVGAADALAGRQVFVEAGALGRADAVDAKNLTVPSCR